MLSGNCYLLTNVCVCFTEPNVQQLNHCTLTAIQKVRLRTKALGAGTKELIRHKQHIIQSWLFFCVWLIKNNPKSLWLKIVFSQTTWPILGQQEGIAFTLQLRNPHWHFLHFFPTTCVTEGNMAHHSLAIAGHHIRSSGHKAVPNWKRVRRCNPTMCTEEGGPDIYEQS